MERPEDVISFLVSPRSEYMTGQALSVNGSLLCYVVAPDGVSILTKQPMFG